MVFGIIPAPVVRHINIKKSIVIIIEHRPAGRPVGCVDPRLFADVFIRTVAVIEVELVGPIVTQEDVLIAVVVDVAADDAVAKAAKSQSRRFGNVLKLVLAQVFVQPVGAFFGRAQRQQRGRREIEIEQAVVVVIEHGHAGAIGGREVLVVVHAGKVHEIDPGFPCDLGKAKRAGLGLLGENDRARDDREPISGDIRHHFALVRRLGAGRAARSLGSRGSAPRVNRRDRWSEPRSR